jgi:hypothetical protein
MTCCCSFQFRSNNVKKNPTYYVFLCELLIKSTFVYFRSIVECLSIFVFQNYLFPYAFIIYILFDEGSCSEKVRTDTYMNFVFVCIQNELRRCFKMDHIHIFLFCFESDTRECHCLIYFCSLFLLLFVSIVCLLLCNENYANLSFIFVEFLSLHLSKVIECHRVYPIFLLLSLRQRYKFSFLSHLLKLRLMRSDGQLKKQS